MKLRDVDPAVQAGIRTSVRNMSAPCYVAVPASCFDIQCREIVLEDTILMR